MQLIYWKSRTDPEISINGRALSIGTMAISTDIWKLILLLAYYLWGLFIFHVEDDCYSTQLRERKELSYSL